jgi:hypothetical protein
VYSVVHPSYFLCHSPSSSQNTILPRPHNSPLSLSYKQHSSPLPQYTTLTHAIQNTTPTFHYNIPFFLPLSYSTPLLLFRTKHRSPSSLHFTTLTFYYSKHFSPFTQYTTLTHSIQNATPTFHYNIPFFLPLSYSHHCNFSVQNTTLPLHYNSPLSLSVAVRHSFSPLIYKSHSSKQILASLRKGHPPPPVSTYLTLFSPSFSPFLAVPSCNAARWSNPPLLYQERIPHIRFPGWRVVPVIICCHTS